MSIFDSIKDMLGGAADKATQAGETAQGGVGDIVDQGKQWVEGQGGVEGMTGKAGELGQQAKDAAGGIDIPGTDIDDQIKEKLGL
jgi:hypothetical protein